MNQNNESKYKYDRFKLTLRLLDYKHKNNELSNVLSINRRKRYIGIIYIQQN
jgi:hypothetical protein